MFGTSKRANARRPGTVLFEARSISGGSWMGVLMTGQVRDAIDLRPQEGSGAMRRGWPNGFGGKRRE
jgi:hypothetical protein